MKKVKKPVFFIVAILIFAFTYLSLVGVHTQYGDITNTWVKGLSDVRWGIDIRGGVDVTFAPPADYNATVEEMDAAKSIIETRMVSKNITDYELYIDYGNNQIIVRFPWQADDESFDAEAAVMELGETALLTFREGVGSSMSVNVAYDDEQVEELPLVLSGSDVESAAAYYNTEKKAYEISLELKDSGKEKFSEVTGRLKGTGTSISIWMDNTLISAPVVSQQITDGSASISGSFDAESAIALANKINGGALPFKLTTESFSTITPTLGMGARDAMALAGLIAIVLIAIVMVAVYRLPGFIAVIALIGQVAGTFAAITGFFGDSESFTLTIPGIAGIILAIGMGVDANVITSERIKEELRAGKTLDGAIQTGYKRAFTAVFDGNITMIIIALILMGAFGTSDSLCAIILSPIFTWFGVSTEGTIYSFGYTLAVGVALNFVFSIFAARLMTSSISKFKAFRKPALYGGVKNEK